MCLQNLNQEIIIKDILGYDLNDLDQECIEKFEEMGPMSHHL